MIGSVIVALGLALATQQAHPQSFTPVDTPLPPPTGVTVVEAKEVTLSFPAGYIMQVDSNITFTPAFVDAMVRSQDVPYLEFVLKSKLPKPQDFLTGKIDVGPPINPNTIGGSYISGRVVEKSNKITLQVDGVGPVYTVVPTPTYPGHVNVWKWVIPEIYCDNKPHKIFAKVYSKSGALLGPMDNARPPTGWSFTIAP
jgi:hypothetical protein